MSDYDHMARMVDELGEEVTRLESALAEARNPARSPEQRKQDEEVVIYHLGKHDRTPKRDRLTPRMEARQIIDALDALRAARHGSPRLASQKEPHA